MSQQIIESTNNIMEEQKESVNTVNVVFKINQKQSTTLSPNALYEKMQEEYNIIEKRGIPCFEYYNAATQKVKVHFDYEEYVDVEKYSDALANLIQEQVVSILNVMFETTTDKWAIAKDCRQVDKKKDKKLVRMYKVSFHLVLIDKKVWISDLRNYIKKNMYMFKDVNIEGIDLNIYRDGYNKFRTPYAKKSASEVGSLLIPQNYTSKKDFQKHLVTCVKDCEDLVLCAASPNAEETVKRDKVKDVVLYNSKDVEESIKGVLSNYTIISEREGMGDYEGMILYDIKEFECGDEHRNNHNFIIHNTFTNLMKVKCHSDRCCTFEKILYVPPRPTLHFDINFLHGIPIPNGAKDNYKQVKQYFEQFILGIRDTNSFYRINYTYSPKYDYYERDVKGINIEGYSDICYKVKDGEEIKNVQFVKKYKSDFTRTSYFNLEFIPHGVNSNIQKYGQKNYNLFSGFNYGNVIDKTKQQNIHDSSEEDLKFLLRHIKKYICDNNDKHYDFFMQYFANLIQDPLFVPQIILVFYSAKHGCHAYDTPILMHNGSIKKVQDIVCGDVLMGDDSTPRTVLKLARGKETMVEINPEQGEKFTVNNSHKLCLKYKPTLTNTKNGYVLQYLNDDKKDYDIISLEYNNREEANKAKKILEEHTYEMKVTDYLRLSRKVQQRLTIYRNPVVFEEKEVYDPYLTGLWIGAGKNKNTKMNLTNISVVRKLKKSLSKNNLYLSNEDLYHWYNIKSNNKNIPNTLYDNLINNDLINNKHIPVDYKCNSRKNQLSLLAGILDGGYYNIRNNSIEYMNKNEKLIDDMIYLSRSLGFSAYKSTTRVLGKKVFVISISGNNMESIPVANRKLQNSLRKLRSNNNHRNLSFTTRVLEKDNYYGFTLDGNNRFVQGDFIVQRNTGKSGLTKFLSNVIGPDLTYFGSLEQITETHSHAHVGKLLNVVEEVDKHSTRRYKDIIKDFSQREVAIYNEKNKPQHSIKCYVRYIMTTNYNDGVFFTDEDRRYCLYSFQKILDSDYINKLQEIMEDKNIVYLFGKYLQDYKVSHKRPNDWIKARHFTQDYFRMRNEDSTIKFFKDLLTLETIDIEEYGRDEYIPDPHDKSDNQIKDCIQIGKTILYRRFYKDFCRENDNGYTKQSNKFKTDIEVNFRNEIKTKRVSNKVFYEINLKKLHERFYPEKKFVNHHTEE
jgi:hypothetical protein